MIGPECTMDYLFKDVRRSKLRLAYSSHLCAPDLTNENKLITSNSSLEITNQ